MCSTKLYVLIGVNFRCMHTGIIGYCNGGGFVTFQWMKLHDFLLLNAEYLVLCMHIPSVAITSRLMQDCSKFLGKL